MELRKKEEIIRLKEKASVQIRQKNIMILKVRVGFVLDISKSMYGLYRDGVMQNVIERVLALAMNFDDDGSLDAFVFGTTAVELKPVTANDFEAYVEREIMAKHKINQATKYATALALIKEKYKKSKIPVFILFLTDGNNSDKKESEALIRELSFYPFFIQFIGIGKEEFHFLNKLDELERRFVDNAGFMHVNDIAAISDEDLYARLLHEFPLWLGEAKKRNLF